MLSDLDMLMEHVLNTAQLVGHSLSWCGGERDKFERLSVGQLVLGLGLLRDWEVRDETIVPGLVI